MNWKNVCFKKSSLKRLLLLAWVALALISCGGGGGSSSGDSAVREGIFIDSPVEGLTYTTETQFGITDSYGSFKYIDGETVTFFIEDLELGQAPANDRVTLLDIVEGAEDITDWRVTNIARVLQSLDWDGDPENGITLTPEISEVFPGRTLDFDLSPEEFENSPEVQEIFDALNELGAFQDGENRTLISATQAQNHLLISSEKDWYDQVDGNDGHLAVFPGAIGFGADSKAGRGGKVLRVTNLNDSGAGSLRAALTASGSRTIIFDVSGTIEWKSNVTIKNPYVTVAGQSAPSPGISVRGAALQISTHDVLLQHLRLRVGDYQNVPNPDGVWIQEGSYNIVVDHCSIAWGIDENASISPPVPTSNPPHDITFSNTVFSEGLYDSVNDRGVHSRGFLLRQSYNVSLVRNLFAHNNKRNPEIHGSTETLLVNNVLYNAGDIKGSMYFSTADGDEHISSIIGNVGIRGPNTPSSWRLAYLRSDLSSGSSIYVKDNLGPGSSSDAWSVIKNDAGSRVKASTPPVSINGMAILPSSSVESHVLRNVGARPADRDSVDERVIDEVATRTGSIIDSQNEVGSWPSLKKNAKALALPSNPNGDDDGDGFTNLEEVLHQMARAVE